MTRLQGLFVLTALILVGSARAQLITIKGKIERKDLHTYVERSLVFRRARIVWAAEVYMGGMLRGGRSDAVELSVSVKGVAGGRSEFIVDGKLDAGLSRGVLSNDDRIRVKWLSDGARHTVYVRVRDKDGKIVLVGNPVYIEG